MSHGNWSFLLGLTVLLLAACGGHPAAGIWVAVERADSKYTEVSVDFDGKAQILPTDTRQPRRNCYWQASGADSISIQCGTSDQAEGSLFYTLDVVGPSLVVLNAEGQVLGQFKRSP